MIKKTKFEDKPGNKVKTRPKNIAKKHNLIDNLKT